MKRNLLHSHLAAFSRRPPNPKRIADCLPQVEVTIATTVAPMPNPITARRKKLLAITCRTGEAGCCNKVCDCARREHVQTLPINSPASGQKAAKPSFLRIRAIGWTRRLVMYRGSNMSCHAGQRTRAHEHLQDEGVRADKQSTAPRGRDIARIHVPQQNALLPRSAHTAPSQP